MFWKEPCKDLEEDLFLKTVSYFRPNKSFKTEGTVSTKTEPYRKYLAHDEKSKFFILFPEITCGKPSKVVWFSSWNMFFNPPKNQNSVTVPRLVTSTQDSVTNTLSKTSLCLICIKITLQFEPGKLFLRSLRPTDGFSRVVKELKCHFRWLTSSYLELTRKPLADLENLTTIS